MLARILAVADYADRHLRRGEVRESVIEKINALSGVRFEPKDAQIMIDILME